MSDDLQALLAGPAPDAHPAGSPEAQNAARAFMGATMGVDPLHPQHGDVLARRDALFARAYPEEAEAAAPPMGSAPEGYSLPPDLPLDPSLAPAEVSGMLAEPQAWAKAAGLSNDEFAQLARRYMAAQENPVTAEQGEQALRAAWGADYDQQLAAARRAVDRIDGGAGKFRQWLRQSGLGSDPSLALRLAALSQQKGW